MTYFNIKCIHLNISIYGGLSWAFKQFWHSWNKSTLDSHHAGCKRGFIGHSDTWVSAQLLTSHRGAETLCLWILSCLSVTMNSWKDRLTPFWLCVCLCVWEREREKESACVTMCVYVYWQIFTCKFLVPSKICHWLSCIVWVPELTYVYAAWLLLAICCCCCSVVDDDVDDNFVQPGGYSKYVVWWQTWVY